MNRTIRLLLATCALAFSGKLQAELPAETNGAEAALIAYELTLKMGDLDAAKDLTAKFDTLSAEALDQYTAKYAAGAKAGKLKIKPVTGSTKILGNFAVVTFSDGKDQGRPDYDPAYLIKQRGKWRVFLKLTSWDNPMFELSADEKKQLGELQEWFNAEKARLYKE